MRRVPELFALLCVATPLAAQTAYVTCQPDEALSLIDVAAGQEQARWSVPGKPAGVATHGDGVYTVSPETKAVRRFGGDGTIRAEVTLDGGPTGTVLDPLRGRLYVSDWYNARLWVLDAQTLKPLQELPTGQSPAGIALSGDGRFLASADKDANQVSIFDAETLQPLRQLPVGTRPYGLAFSRDGRLFVGNVGTNDLSVLDVTNGETLATIPVGERPYGVTFAAGRAFVTNQYANTVSVIALDTLAYVATLDVGEYPEGIDATPDGRHVVLANWFDNTVSVIDATTLDVIHEIDTCDGPRAFGLFIPGGEDR